MKLFKITLNKLLKQYNNIYDILFVMQSNQYFPVLFGYNEDSFNFNKCIEHIFYSKNIFWLNSMKIKPTCNSNYFKMIMIQRKII